MSTSSRSSLINTVVSGLSVVAVVFVAYYVYTYFFSSMSSKQSKEFNEVATPYVSENETLAVAKSSSNADVNVENGGGNVGNQVVQQAMDSNYLPYQAAGAGQAYRASFPESEDPASISAPPAARYQMNLDQLMPASWRGPSATSGEGDGCAESVDGQWAKYAPTKGAFARYQSAAGSARLSMNTRNTNKRNLGVRNLLRPSPPLPMSTREFAFNDSSFRNDLVYNATGFYPEDASC